MEKNSGPSDPTDETVVDVHAAWDLLNALREKPYVMLKINGKSTEFLCDSGACKTVLKTQVPGLKQSQNSIWVKSADGETHKEYFSKTLTIEDEETKLTISASVVISPKCPVNLLGRDLMTRLGIAIIPIKDGMRACRVRDADVYASSTDDNSVYCSYDLNPKFDLHLPSRMLR